MGRGVIKEANKNPSTDFGDNKALINWIPNSFKEAEMDQKFRPSFQNLQIQSKFPFDHLAKYF